MEKLQSYKMKWDNLRKYEEDLLGEIIDKKIKVM